MGPGRARAYLSPKTGRAGRDIFQHVSHSLSRLPGYTGKLAIVSPNSNPHSRLAVAFHRPAQPRKDAMTPVRCGWDTLPCCGRLFHRFSAGTWGTSSDRAAFGPSQTAMAVAGRPFSNEVGQCAACGAICGALREFEATPTTKGPPFWPNVFRV
ncbi:hypothetical protein ERJ75_000973500 [Trypanosoma vivax]|nr:hypothetical protein ERJ75_000973500 [Trypanosoma vivax]